MKFTRRDLILSAGASSAIGLLPGCMAAPRSAAASDAGAEAEAARILDIAAENLLRHSPEQATSLGIDEGERAALRSQLMDRSQAGQDRLAAQLRTDLAHVDAIDAAALPHAQRTSVEVVRSAYRLALDGFALPYGDIAVGGWRNTPYVVIQNVGAYLDVPRFLDAEHQIESAADAEAYLARLASYPRQLDGELGRLKAAGAQGLVAPAFLIDKALGQLKLAAEGAREGGSLVESIERRTREKNIPGDWVTPEEVHQMGLDKLKALHGRMDPILRQLGYTQGSVGARMQALSKDPRYQFPEGDKGRAEIMAYIQEWLARIRTRLPRAFNTLVKGNLEVRRLPPEEEPGAPGAYGGAGSIDGSIPGKYWINLRTTDLHRKYDLPDLSFHEAIPGHVWQGEYANKLPLIRTMLAFNAYSEGWALYAEQLADELGMYDDFAVGRLGYLQSLAFRACRLVVDTGLHTKRWTREQGVRFFVDVNGSKPEEVASEVDRYCSWPGQACGYKVGHSEIVRLRGAAQAALGDRYDLKAFNDTVLLGGNVPLDVLAKNVEAYIAEAKA